MNFEKSVCRFMIIMGLLEVEQKVYGHEIKARSRFLRMSCFRGVIFQNIQNAYEVCLDK